MLHFCVFPVLSWSVGSHFWSQTELESARLLHFRMCSRALNLWPRQDAKHCGLQQCLSDAVRHGLDGRTSAEMDRRDPIVLVAMGWTCSPLGVTIPGKVARASGFMSRKRLSGGTPLAGISYGDSFWWPSAPMRRRLVRGGRSGGRYSISGDSQTMGRGCTRQGCMADLVVHRALRVTATSIVPAGRLMAGPRPAFTSARSVPAVNAKQCTRRRGSPWAEEQQQRRTAEVRVCSAHSRARIRRILGLDAARRRCGVA